MAKKATSKTAKKSPLMVIIARAKELKKTDSKTEWKNLVKKAAAQIKKESK
jgi:hypothetical protein